MDEIKFYGVSYGNGNDGVSQSYPAFYCQTDKPYALARLAIITNFVDRYQAWAAENAEVDGEAEYTISATLYEGPDGETEFGAAWLIVEVFEAEPNGRKPEYDSLEECFGADVVARFGKED